MRRKILFSVLMTVILLGMFVLSLGVATGSTLKTTLDESKIKSHINYMSIRPHSVVDLDDHARVNQYIRNTLESKGVLKSSTANNLTSASYTVFSKWVKDDMDGSTIDHLLHNIIVHIPGTTEKTDDAVLIMAHYDSVPMGPGASDDLVGVAVMLESISYVLDIESRKNDYVFLFVDGEEFGLLGSKMYMDDFKGYNDIVKRTKFAVNLESRGTNGTLIMFETSNNNYESIELFSKINAQIFSNSIANMVYQSMPNGTDFSNVKNDYQGLNFANLGGGHQYHTQNDSFKNMGNTYLTQQANLASNLIIQTKDMNLKTFSNSQGNAVFFTYLSATIYYKTGFAVALGIMVLLLFIGLIAMTIYKKQFAFKKGLISFAVVVFMLGISAIVGIIIYYLLNYMAVLFGVIDIKTVGQITYSNYFLVVMFVAVITFVFMLLKRYGIALFKIKANDLHKMFTYMISVITIALSWVLQEVSFLFLFLALPLLIYQIIKVWKGDNAKVNEVYFNLGVVAFNLPIILPVLFLAILALGSGMTYVYAILIGFMILPMVLVEETILDLLLKVKTKIKLFNQASIKITILLLILIFPMIIGVTSRTSLSDNLTGKQSLFIYGYDDALVYVKDIDNSYLMVKDLNAYPVLKANLSGFTFNEALNAYTKQQDVDMSKAAIIKQTTKNNEISFTKSSKQGFYELSYQESSNIKSVTITYGDGHQQSLLKNETHRFVRNIKILIEKVDDTKEATLWFREVIVNDASFKELDVFKVFNEIKQVNYIYQYYQLIHI